jgi:hypothetical protein
MLALALDIARLKCALHDSIPISMQWDDADRGQIRDARTFSVGMGSKVETLYEACCAVKGVHRRSNPQNYPQNIDGQLAIDTRVGSFL